MTMIVGQENHDNDSIPYIRILNINRVEMQVGHASEVVEYHLPDEVIALALKVLVREEVARAYDEEFTWE